jgi:uncharacterized protein (TIGR03437 family)
LTAISEDDLVNRTYCKNICSTAFVLCVTAIGLPAQNLTTLASFGSTYAGGGPASALVQGTDGSFYGTTPGGGPSQNGTIFKIAPDGTFTTLYGFCAQSDCPDGSLPNGLVQASDGNLYGTTQTGGANNSQGTVFKITPAGTLTTLYSFCPQSSCADGENPLAGLIQASDGNFYGTTSASGASTHFGGTVFKITPSGKLTTLYNFCSLASCADGSQPAAGLTQGSDGNFYGTTPHGGANTENNDGTVFKITPGGTLTTLHSFCSVSDCADGLSPATGLIQASDGNFYGTSADGGPGGSVYKITPGGTFTTVYSFCSGGSPCIDGKTPSAGLIQASDGNLYGTTSTGGVNSSANAGAGGGTVFKITLSGSLTTVYSFCSQHACADGLGPKAGLIQASDGSFIGATVGGGPHGAGTVFRLVPGSSPAVPPAINTSGGVVNGASFQSGIAPDSWITISGTNLASKTDTWANAIVNGKLPTTLDGVSVSVGGDPAYVYYISPTQINAIAPNLEAGAANVIVTNSSGISSPASTVVQTARPAFFLWPGGYAVATRQDFSLAVKNGTFPGTTTVPAKPGDVIILWGTGFGPTSPSTPVGVEVPSSTAYNTANAVSVTVGGKTATVYGAALAAGFAGLYQVAIQIPAALANGDYPAVATVSGAQSPSTTLITVQE